MSELKIATWNANGLRTRIAELINFLAQHNIDIMMINETRYTAQMKLKIKNYTCIRKDIGSTAGGVAMLIKNTTPYKEIKTDITTSIEHICIKLSSNINIITVYNSSSKEFTSKELHKILETGKKIIVLGDLNARHQAWNCHISNKRGRTLYNYTANHNCTIIYPEEPTHYSENGTTSTTIDIGIIKNIAKIPKITVINELNSDHTPVLITLKSQYKSINNRKERDYDKANWKKFKKLLHNKTKITNRINTTEQLEAEVQKLTQNIQNSINNTIPIKTHKQIQDRFPPEIIQKITERNRTRKKWQITRNGIYKENMQEQTKEIRKLIHKHRNETWERKLKKINPRDNTIWKMTKIFKNEYIPIPTLEQNSVEAYTDTQKANMLAKHYEQIHDLSKSADTKEHEEIEKHVQQYLNNINNAEWYKHITSPREIISETTK